MKISEIEKNLNKTRKVKGDCNIVDMFMNKDEVTVIFEDKENNTMMYSIKSIKKKSLFGMHSEKTVKEKKETKAKVGVYWGNKTDEEMQEINNNSKW